MIKIESFRHKKVLLFSGIFFYFIGFACIIISHYFFQIDFGSQPVTRFFQEFPSLFIIMALLLAPLFEELAFRSWVIKKKIFKHISYIIINVVCYIIFSNIIVLILVLIWIFALYYLVKNDEIKIILLIITTSVLFVLLHLPNFKDFYSKTFYLLMLFGVSLTLTYIGLRFGFIYCIVSHFLYNMIIISLSIFVFYNYSGNFGNENYNANVESLPILKRSQSFYHQTDSLHRYLGYIPEIASQIATANNTNLSTVYDFETSSVRKYKMHVELHNKQSGNFRQQLLNDFICYAKLKTDTIYKPAYKLIFTDTIKLKDKSPPKDTTWTYDIESLVLSLRSIYDINVLLDSTQPNYSIYIYLSLFHTGFIIDKDEAVKEIKDKLYSQYGIIIKEDKNLLITDIIFKD